MTYTESENWHPFGDRYKTRTYECLRPIFERNLQVGGSFVTRGARFRCVVESDESHLLLNNMHFGFYFMGILEKRPRDASSVRCTGRKKPEC